LKEEKKFFEYYITLDPSVVLYDTVLRAKIKNAYVDQIIKEMLDDGNDKSLALASIINAIFTQKTSAFAISRRVLNDLMKSDPNHDKNDLNTRSYVPLVNMLTENDFWEVKEEQKGRRPALFIIKSPQLITVLKEEMFGKKYDEIQNDRIKAYYMMVNKEPKDNDEVAKSVAKSLEKYNVKRS